MFLGSIPLTHAGRISRTTSVYYLSWTVLALLSTFVYFWGKYYGLTFTDSENSIIVVTILIAASLLFYGIFGRNSRVGEMIRYLALWIATFPIGAAFTYLLAWLNFPLIDIELDKFDKALGFDWLNWFNFLKSHPSVKFVLAAAYASVSLQTCFSIVYFSHRKESERSNELWWIAVTSLVITTIISGFLPAIGTFEHFGVADAHHGVHLHDLHALRDHTLANFSLDQIQGIITLPSYHTVLAILLTYIYRNQHCILLIVLPLNFLMLVAIPSEGGHYLGDIITGGAVAALSIWIVERTFYKSKRLCKAS